jgi:hypothetical protein
LFLFLPLRRKGLAGQNEIALGMEIRTYLCKKR